MTRLTLHEHARQLAQAFNIRLIESAALKPHEAIAIVTWRVVLAPSIVEDATYAVVLHEIGHLVAPLGHIPGATTERAQIDQERAAWEWARHYALEWTPTMEDVARMCEASYTGQYEPDYPVGPAPTPAPEPIHQPINWEIWTRR